MKEQKFINLDIALKAFNQPDPKADEPGYAQPGDHEILEYLKNVETDYAKINDPKLGEVWICTRWNKTLYGTLLHKSIEEEKQEDHPLPDFPRASDEQLEAHPLQFSIPEVELIDLLGQFKDFSYDLHQPTYPFQLSGASVPQAPPFQNNCCTFVEGLIAKAYENVTGKSWSSKDHSQMMIQDASDFFSPITCLVDKKIAVPIDENNTPGPWTVIQGWRKRWSGGHTFIILDHHKPTDRVLTLESNKAYELNGVGFRMLGNYGQVGNPGPEWWANTNLRTWQKIKITYPIRKHCALNVENIQWVDQGN